MKNKFLIVLLAAAMLLTAFCGCGSKKISDEEAVEILTGLLPKSAEINELVWGEGLPIADGQDPAFDTVTAAQYRKVAPDAKYQSIEEMKTAIAEVYSDDFIAKTINYTAFEGAEGALEEEADKKLYPRYYEENGVLWTDITNKGFELTTVIDPSTARVTAANGNRQTLSVKAEVMGKETELTLVIVEQENGWRLDTPTY